MIIHSLSQPREAAPSGPRPAAQVFLDSQSRLRAPFDIVFQAEHSRLAGDLARALRGNVFGELGEQVLHAIAEHDAGWEASDANQLRLLGSKAPRPFPSLSAAETLPSWETSLIHAASLSPVAEVLVSRHLCLLGAGDAARAEFVERETKRRAQIEQALRFASADLERWTAALGFCDLLSLYLCSGCTDPVTFPLAHPADPAAAVASTTLLEVVRCAAAVLVARASARNTFYRGGPGVSGRRRYAQPVYARMVGTKFNQWTS